MIPAAAQIFREMSNGKPVMQNPKLSDLIFKDRPGDVPGTRAELVVTLALGFVVTGFWSFLYQHPVTVAISALASLTALLSLVQDFRGKPRFPFVFPSIVMVDVIAISIINGHGIHDLIWMSGLGVFLLVNIYSPQTTSFIPPIFAFATMFSFAGIGILEMSAVIPNPHETDMRYLLSSASLMLGVMGAITAVFHRHRTLMRTESQTRQEQEHSRLELETANRTLEEQVRQRTNELQALNEQLLTKSAKLQAAAEISQAILINPHDKVDDLLARAARLISEKLGYYHVGIFLIDSSRDFAVLKASNSRGGQEMLTQGHQLRVGGTGIVGYVSQSGIPRIALDTGADAIFFNNPRLPGTRSELSVPIKYGSDTIGVLDVQSTQSSAFNEEDAGTLSTIANQLALILHQKEEIEAVARNRGVRSLRSFDTMQKQLGYSYNADGSIVENTAAFNPFFERAVISGETIAAVKTPYGNNPILIVPVRVREQVIGIIQIESSEENRNWTEDEILLVQTVSDRAGLALDNAGLLENATQRAMQEETISRLTNQIGSSTDFERIMRTTVQELGLALGASRSFIQIGMNTSTNEEGVP